MGVAVSELKEHADDDRREVRRDEDDRDGQDFRHERPIGRRRGPNDFLHAPLVVAPHELTRSKSR